MSNLITLPKSEAKVYFVEEVKGKTIKKMEKALMRAFDMSGSTKQKELNGANIKFNDEFKIKMDFATDLIESIEDKDGNPVKVNDDFIDNLGLTDYKVIEEEVNNLTEGVDFF